MRVLYYTKYSRLGASSRLRSYQYFPYFEEAGITISVSPLFDDAYLTMLYQGKKSVKNVILAYVKRFLSLFSLFKYDKIIIEKELFPYFFPCFELLLSLLGKPYIVDYDDAIFHNYDLNKNRWIRFFLKRKIDFVMRFSNCVIAGNSYLSERAQKAGAKKIIVLPTVIDIERYPIQRKIKATNIVIGWIGSPSTFKYVEKLKAILEQLAAKYDVRYHIVGAKSSPETEGCFQFIPWTEATEVAEIAQFDIGIMPLNTTPWELGKCSYKLIQYMGCGLPVVASPVGMNKEVVKEGINGFLATTEEEWISALETLILDKDLRNKLGVEGRQSVEYEFCLQRTNDLLRNLIAS